MGEIPFSQGSIRNQGANIRIVSQPSKGDNVACRGTQIPGARASSLSRVYAVTNHASTAPRQVREVHTYANERHAFLSPKATHYSLYFRLRLGQCRGPTFLHRSSRRRRHKARDGRVRNDEEMRNIKLDLVLGWASGEPAHDSQFFGFVGVQRSTRVCFGYFASTAQEPAAVRRVGGVTQLSSAGLALVPGELRREPWSNPSILRAAKACAQCYLPARSRSFSPRKVNDSAPGGYKGKVLFIMNDRGWLAAVIAELYWWAFDVPSRGISSISLYFFTDTAPETSLDTANGEEKNYPTANVLEAARRNERVPVRVQHQAAKVCLHPARKLPVLPLTLQPSVIAMNRSQIVLAQNFLLTQSTSARNGLWVPSFLIFLLLRNPCLRYVYSALVMPRFRQPACMPPGASRPNRVDQWLTDSPNPLASCVASYASETWWCFIPRLKC
ncbi:hypothetical protein CIHG_03288 [Coccidioides immitis H538.4]|uniref:Uncharacterized protein n=1 Tax=Coccidioides immitis H538.4 TaxID=396776 RepID=A0A0J8RK16_COCIT|nr:hypothetical protein CIHG_03288 [Coccidioides immitis H538.4]